MASELIINARPHETRVALVENGIVVEMHIERETGQELHGNIYRGRVVKVLPGMQAAFVDIGLDRTAFLYVGDVCNPLGEIENYMLNGQADPENGPGPAACDVDSATQIETTGFPIEDLLTEGQCVLVQVAKEPIGRKGARITCHISIPGRHLVLMPTFNHIGVSRRIEDKNERERLRNLIQELRPKDYGFIARTVCEGAAREKLRSEMEFLLRIWSNIQIKMEKGAAPALLHKDLSVTLRAVRDLFTMEVDRLVIDSEDEYRHVMEFIRTFSPHLEGNVELYQGADPIFEVFGIEMETSRFLQNKIWLKSGGYIVIEATEALTAIDVNTGSYVGKINLEDTILKTNLEAVKEIAYQLRFRNIGGLIVIDFIDMEKIQNRERVFQVFKEVLSRDKAKTNVLPISELGLIEMTRKRTRAALRSVLMEACPYCEGTGRIKSKKTICYDLLRDLERECLLYPDRSEVFALVHPEIETVLREDEQESVMDLERRLRKRIVILSRDHFHIQQYQVGFRDSHRND